MAQQEVVTSSVEDSVAVIRIANPPVNALSAAVRGGLKREAEAAAANPAIRAIVIVAEGKTFIAGADITEFGKPPVPPSLPEVIAILETLAKPVVAAINGAALGGGLEVALGCHARVAAPSAKLGLPEVKLGILPGAGGTQRLPRLIGTAPAVKIAAEGNPISAKEAQSLGLVDEVAEDVVPAAKALALKLAGGTLPTPARDRANLGAREAFEEAAAALLKKNADNPSVAAVVDAVRACFEKSFEEGLAVERAHFLRLRDDPRSKALRHVFFAERAAARIPNLPKGTQPRPVAKAAVIGGGTMGGGIAMCFANAGIPVTLIETSEENLQRGLERVAGNYATSVKRGSLTEEARDKRMSLIEGKVGLENAAGADVVVEAVFEEMGLKKEIFGKLEGIAKPGAVLATNTSYLDVDEIAASTSRPGDVLGMHFFSPANVMKLLEVVRGAKTSPEVLATAMDLGRKLAKVPVVSGVCYGFIGNRMLARRTAMAERLLLEGAQPKEVDKALTDFGFRMGPFAMADLAGLDIGWRIRKATGKKAPVADALCEAGRLGQKTKRGYYDYSADGRTGAADPEVAALIERVSAEQGIARRAIPQDEILERLLYPMINEGARILEEGIALRAGDIDTVWLNGYGWPAWTGGPMFHADSVGLPKIVARLREFAAGGDESLQPAPLLVRLAEQGSSFAALDQKAA
ncbi:3-hydroxyacyl-CoA dehydrogenase NAD-binding domain-containing protein [Roseomonas xinghualingensis]|uniref:3-hydroxyacyl-CoA dehydrogenase NAD-binding domain-containing protein n=1 Tax=Roseomonas xinghualingensis TaxID=2986475 RepID=UPI0021F0CC40|nr:3-hydroxyacyl-CoA dehydrogenase NAD-binding domain-containing protein [Roseomonas sp. SXEYE001]MCV4207055.1 3-hydroxyacyl-CoA dehydrogenase NAD-binding domain-containing protein [Roseomonas sp. SXEYE001]